jgi:serine/threonine-protein kinase HipA
VAGNRIFYGNGRNLGKKELLAVGLQAGLEKSWCKEVIEKMKNTVEERLEKYL